MKLRDTVSPKKLCMHCELQTMLTWCSSESCVPSALDFEVASDSVVHYCLLPLGHQVTANICHG